MSNKTTFKRIALAVVVALGFGALASAPSNAAPQNVVVTVTNGAISTLATDSATTASIKIDFLALAAGESITTRVFQRAAYPVGTTTNPTDVDGANIMWWDSATTAATTMIHETASSLVAAVGANDGLDRYERAGLSNTVRVRAAAAGQHSVTYKVDLGDSSITVAGVGRSDTLTAGTYSFTAVVSYLNSNGQQVDITRDFDIVVSKTAATLAAESKTVDPAKTIAHLSGVTNDAATVLTADSALSVSATAATAAKAYLRVKTFNAANQPAPESVTVTITGAGVLRIGSSGAVGSSLLIAGDGNDEFEVLSDGRAGVGSIVVATTSKTFPAKTITFYATDPATYTPSLDVPVIGVTAAATADVVSIVAKDSNGNIWGGSTLYLFSSDTSVAANATCAFDAADQVHYCGVQGLKAGETKWTIGNKSTLALSTVKSAEFAGPRVSAATPASVKIEFDKAAYAPGEKARIYVTPLDADGKTLPGGEYASLLAATGITANVAFSSGSDTTSATTIATEASASATTGDKAGSAMYTVYMPFGKGTVTLTAKGGTALPVAARVALTASADVVDDAVDAAVDAAQEATDAAIAATDAAILAQEAADEAASAAIAAQETAQAAVDAVTALSAEVTKLVAQLATLQKLLNRVAKRVGVKR